FPILFGEKFLGVMEFFSHEIREPDEAVLTLFASIGGQIGQFMERKRTEQSLVKAARQQEALYQLVDRLHHAESLPDIYDSALDAILSALQCDRASILLFDESNVMRFVGWRGLSDGYRKAAEGHSPWKPEEKNPKPVSINNIYNADIDASLKTIVESEGIGALCFIPLVSNGKLIGKFMTYFNAPNVFSDDELELSLTIARQLAFGIDRKRAEEMLRENAERLRLATQTGKVGIWDWDISSNRVSWTNSLYRIHGVKKEEFDTTVEGFVALVHPYDRDFVSKAIKRSLSGNAPYELEFRAVKPDGEVIWLFTSATVLRSDGRPIRMLGATLDITERKKAEAMLRRAMEFDEAVMNNMGEGLYTVDTQGMVMSMNPAAEKLFGWTFDELRGRKMHDLTHYKHRDGTPFPAEECVGLRVIQKGETLVNHEDVFIRKDGTFFEVVYSSSPIRENGEIVGLVIVFRDITELKRTQEALQKAHDELEIKVRERTRELLKTNEELQAEITERKRAEDALEKSRDYYLKLLDEFPTLIWRSGVDAKCDYFNKSWLEFTGITMEQGIGDGWTEGVHIEDLDRCVKTYIDAFNRREPFEMEYRLRRHDGEYRWIIDFGRPFYDLGGEFGGYLGLCYDITEHKKMEEERLKISKLESVGVLAGGIAHDFNNMLAGIFTTISLMKMDVRQDTRMHKDLTEVEKACLQAKGLTQQLLTFAKGGAPIKKLCSVEEIIRDTATFALRGSKAKYDIGIEKDIWDVEVDEGQIAQVISNLIINADQSMPQGGVIKIDAENIEIGAISSSIKPAPTKEGRYVRITVEDSGIGISPEHLGRIFDPYFTTKQKGSGLGLATSYSIIKNHGGYIGVESELGKGTKFYVYLPASEKRAEEKKRVQEKVEGGVKGRVLIMDDEAIIRTAAGRALMRMGYEVGYAKGGEEALEIYKRAKDENKPFDVVIMDLTIPGGMGGKEAIKRLKDIDPDVKAIVSSGYSTDPIMSDYKQYGLRGVVSKPYSIEELAQTLHKVMNGE
ncbi:MAG: PAS domain S-box protein, partial [Ignavibacteriales bacterium]